MYLVYLLKYLLTVIVSFWFQLFCFLFLKRLTILFGNIVHVLVFVYIYLKTVQSDNNFYFYNIQKYYVRETFILLRTMYYKRTF